MSPCCRAWPSAQIKEQNSGHEEAAGLGLQSAPFERFTGRAAAWLGARLDAALPRLVQCVVQPRKTGSAKRPGCGCSAYSGDEPCAHARTSVSPAAAASSMISRTSCGCKVTDLNSLGQTLLMARVSVLLP